MMEFSFTEDQQKAYDNIINFIEKEDNTMALLDGAAGVGKSTLCSKIIDYMMNHGLFGKMALAAPTWRAVKVAKAMVKQEHRENIDFTSLHSLLGLTRLITKDGKEIYKKDPKSPCKLSFYDLVIVDESSMISDELFQEIQKQNIRGTKILFVGDANQINPVNHTHAIPMLPDERKKYGINVYNLTKIVRQAEGNPIIKNSQDILNDSFNFVPGKKNLVDKTGVVMLNGNSEILRNLLKYYFCSEEFDRDSTHARVLAWRNNTVDMYNSIIRKMKYGNAPKIVVNEKLIADKPITDIDSLRDDEVLFTTNEDLVVLEVEEKEKVLPQGTFKYYKTLVRGDEDQEHYIHILHEKSEKQYNIQLSQLSGEAIKETDIKKRIEKWKKYYAFIGHFSSVAYAYALTVHNSQGGTFGNVFVMYNDIISNRRKEEMKRILYTACTRPKSLLYIS